MHPNNRFTQRFPLPCRPFIHRALFHVTVLVTVFVTALATAGAASAGDLGPLAPNLPAPVTQAENDIVIDPLYLSNLCDYSASQLWNDWNIAGQVGIASIAKVMTYHLTLNALDPGLAGFSTTPNACVTIASDADESVPAMMNPPLQEGSSVPLDVLLHGMMKRSSNGAARAIGKFVSDGIAGEPLSVGKAEDDFISRMNERASELELFDTTYCSRSGSSISTPEDQFRLWMAASKHSQFYNWTAPGNHSGMDCGGTINFVNNRVGGAVIGMEAFKDGNQGSSGAGACAGKPTCTDCLITEANRLGRTLLSFQHKGPMGAANRWGDAQALFGYGFGKLFTPDLRAHALEPDTLLRAQAIDAMTSHLAVSAVVTDDPIPGGDALQVCGWSVDAENGSLSMGTCTNGGTVAAIPGGPSACSLGSKLGVDVSFVRLGTPEVLGGGGIEAPLFVTAVTNPDNHVTELRSWTVVPAPPFEPQLLGPSATFVGNDVVIHRVTDSVFLTVFNDCGALRIKAWKMNADGTFLEIGANLWDRGTVLEHAVNHGAALNIGGSVRIPLVTPVRLNSEEVTLLTWHFDLSTGQVIVLDDPPTSIQGSALSISPVNLTSPVSNDRFFLMSYRRKNNYQHDSAIFQVPDNGSASEVAHNSMSSATDRTEETHILPLGDLGLATAVRTQVGPEQLRLTVWEPREDQGGPPSVGVLRVADESADDLLPGVDLLVDEGGLDFRPLPMNGNPAEADYLTSRLNGGYLEIDVWRVAPRPDLGDSLCCGNGQVDPGEDCDGTDFGGLSCNSFGYDMGDLTCNNLCQAIPDSCENGESIQAPTSYGDCGYSTEDCDDDPSLCNADGDCIGGPCRQTDPGDRDLSALLSPLNFGGMFHPDGNFRDQLGNLYFCEDGEEQAVCIDNDGWGVCTRCGQEEGETMLGCPCTGLEDQCGAGLSCYGEDFGDGQGFCWDEIEGPPSWQCDQGPCGQVPWYGDDEMYCEHYPVDGGDARCEPAYGCVDGPTAKTCAAEGTICLPPSLPEEEVPEEGPGVSEQCTSECQTDDHCSEAFFWPPGYTCENTASGLQCQYTGL